MIDVIDLVPVVPSRTRVGRGVLVVGLFRGRVRVAAEVDGADVYEVTLSGRGPGVDPDELAVAVGEAGRRLG